MKHVNVVKVTFEYENDIKMTLSDEEARTVAQVVFTNLPKANDFNWEVSTPGNKSSSGQPIVKKIKQLLKWTPWQHE